MTLLLKTKPKKILIQQPDLETVRHLHQHILNIAPDAEIYAPANVNEIEQYYLTVSDIDLLIAEVYIEGIDALASYLTFRAAHPKVAVLIATRYDLSSYSEYIHGVPVVVLPYEEKHLESIIPQLLDKMSPSELTTSISRKIPIGTQSIKLVQKNKAAAASSLDPKNKAASPQKLATPVQRVGHSKSVIEVEKELKRRSRNFNLFSALSLLIIISTFCLLVYLGQIPSAYRYFRFLELPWTDYREMIAIPEGEFLYGGDNATPPVPKNTAPFWIDKYEVTLGQYQKFLKAIEKEAPEAYAHPDMPNVSRGFKPENWDEVIHSIREGIPYEGVHLNLNCPVFNVRWWNAYAYAKWAGKRLPTEEEWEKAARGTKGNLFSWGNDEKTISKANLGLDYSPGDPAKGGFNDGFHMMNPVTKKPEDISDFGVVGMNGNVSEWTGTWAEGKLEGFKAPVIRGGSFVAHKNIYLNLRIVKRDANTPEEWLGFRCVRDTSPTSK